MAKDSALFQKLMRVAEIMRYRVRRFRHRLNWKRRAHLRRHRKNLLPTLIQVLAGFSNFDSSVLEEEIDSSLGFLRHDYPEAMYSELRRQFRQALIEQPNLDAMAYQLAEELSMDRKILLAIQLYDLITRAGKKPEHIETFYSFVTKMGMDSQAIDIVLQLNLSEPVHPTRTDSPFEFLSFGASDLCDVIFRDLDPDERVYVYRYRDLILVRNFCSRPITVNARPLQRGDSGRLYEGQRLVIKEHVLTYQELYSYFNAKMNAAVSTIYLALNSNDDISFERSRTKESVLEVTFSLKVKVRALKTLDATLNQIPLREGVYVEAALEDKIIFHNDSELLLSDLRRRARAMGGHFHLSASKSEYLVSNDPNLLSRDDILLSQNTLNNVLLRIVCDYEQKVGVLEVLQSTYPVLVRGEPVRGIAALEDGDIIRIDAGQVLRCNFTDRVIEEERNLIYKLEARDLSVSFRPEIPNALDAISFTANRGEMVCIMGPSGSGKSTLLRAIAGQLMPKTGHVLLNNQSLYGELEEMRSFVSYIPQEDAFDELLTIEENLSLAAALRSPHLSPRELARRIDTKLIELGLSERRHSIVGSPIKKALSGGERKRLNIGLDMISLADVFLFDEPTSGLSSKDSEHVLEIIRDMSHNKVVMVTIHQPSSKLFQMFHKVLLMDKGGKLVFFGTPTEALSYFAQAEHQQHFGVDLEECQSCGHIRPEFIFDVLETPLRDVSGEIIYEENNLGQLVPARRYPPDYWRDKYETYRVLKEVQQYPSAKRDQPSAALQPLEKKPLVPIAHPRALQKRRRLSRVQWSKEWTQFKTLFQRAFLSKLRNRANLLTTMVEAPVLALLIGLVLRYSETGYYDFSSAYHIPTYLFLSLVVAMFLGLTNSADDIVRDRSILHRERNLKVRLHYYVIAKMVTLCFFATIQCALFVAIGNYILQVRGMFWIDLVYTSLTAYCGIALGLFVSSSVNDAKTAVNIVPLILIPQIIMSGALIKYEEMNRNLNFLHKFETWIVTHPPIGHPHAPPPEPSKLEVPFVCQFLPTRWSYEAMVVAQAKLNPLTSRQDALQSAIQKLASKEELTDADANRLDVYKELLAKLSSLEAGSSRALQKDLHAIDYWIKHPEAIAPNEEITLPGQGTGVSAEQLYENQKISDLVAKAEMEQNDYRSDVNRNTFFGLKKYLGEYSISTHVFNIAVLICFILLVSGFLLNNLKRQLRSPRA